MSLGLKPSMRTPIQGRRERSHPGRPTTPRSHSIPARTLLSPPVSSHGPLLDAETEFLTDEEKDTQLLNRSHWLHRTLSMEDILADAKKILMSVHSSILTRMSSALMELPLVETPMMKTTAATPGVMTIVNLPSAAAQTDCPSCH